MKKNQEKFLLKKISLLALGCYITIIIICVRDFSSFSIGSNFLHNLRILSDICRLLLTIVIVFPLKFLSVVVVVVDIIVRIRGIIFVLPPVERFIGVGPIDAVGFGRRIAAAER
ncbi:hypothetical protein DERP_011127 [Dermatophagoides pteronyssinus]|uniref:Uncharacterized protein n=1 Tax=Dermatophagoides pteronyssinus TaxID=6956 RepID=A0ABQ8J8V1_DERPT|nr:hypothetical protein DERP_011127 [Dermatophagoides pteronyssinus]